MKLSSIKRDRKLSEGGVWWNFETGDKLATPHEKDLCILVAEAQNPRFRDAHARLRMLRHVELRAAGDRLPALLQEIGDEATAETVLLDWRNMEGEDGQPVPYSREKALAILRDPDLWQFRQAVMDFSAAGLAYRREVEEAAVGN